MITSFMTARQAGFGVPVLTGRAVRAAAVRTLPLLGGVALAATVAGTARRTADLTLVDGYIQDTDGVATGALPGTPAWSPPI